MSSASGDVAAPPSKWELMTQAGISTADQEHADYIITRESSWQHDVWNSQGSSAYGLPQRMMSAWPLQDGETFMADPVAQLEWADWYAVKSYGSWASARQFWEANKWW